MLRRLAPPPPIQSSMPPRPMSTTLDRGGLRPLVANTLLELRGAVASVEWRVLARESKGWLARVRSSFAALRPFGQRASRVLMTWRTGGVRSWLTELRRVPRRRALGLALLAALGMGLGALFWSRDVPTELSERARQGEPAALGTLAAMPAKKRGAPASVALATGYFNSGQFAPALDALSEALAAGADVMELPDVLEGVRRAADDATTHERALELAATRLGRPGVDLLFDVWSSTGAKTPATRSARKWLDSEKVRAAAPPAVTVALELREAKACPAVLELLPRVTEVGDERSLLPLRRLQSGTGCGFLSLEDCYSCLRGGPALEQAILAVTERPAPKF
jgi:hypothetical protein